MPPLLLRPHRRILAAAIVVAFAVRAFHLDHQALWSDEDITLDRSQKPVTEVLASLPVEQAPLYPVFMRGWTQLAGTTDWSLRFPSLLFGVLAVPLAWFVGRRLAGTRPALILAWTIALHPFLVWYGQEARMYTLLMLWGLAAPAAWLRSEQATSPTQRLGWQLATGAFTALAVYTHYYGALTVFVLVGWALRDSLTRDRRRVQSWLVAGVTALLLYLPWAGRSLGVLGHQGWRAPLPRMAALAADLTAWTGGRTLGEPQANLALMLFILFGAIGIGDLMRSKGQAALRARLWLIVPGFIGLALLIRSTDSDPRYFMSVLPALYLAMAVGLAASPRPLRQAAFVVLLALAGWGLLRMYTDPAVQKQAFRPLLQTVEAAAGFEDTVLFLDGPALGLVRRYELPRSAVKVVNLRSSGNRSRDKAEIEARMAELAAEYPHLWLAEDGEASGLGADWLDRHAHSVSSQGFQSITLRRYESLSTP